jgi:hypothetical protein
MNSWEAFDRLKNVQDELEAARFSVGAALKAAQADVTILAGLSYRLKPSHLRGCADNLEFTYVLRVFAEFEAVVRDFWASARPSVRRRRTQMQVLMNRVAIECQIPAQVLHNAHEIREYRNAAIHDRRRSGEFTFQRCKSRLGFFLSYLPRRW